MKPILRAFLIILPWLFNECYTASTLDPKALTISQSHLAKVLPVVRMPVIETPEKPKNCYVGMIECNSPPTLPCLTGRLCYQSAHSPHLTTRSDVPKQLDLYFQAFMKECSQKLASALSIHIAVARKIVAETVAQKALPDLTTFGIKKEWEFEAAPLLENLLERLQEIEADKEHPLQVASVVLNACPYLKVVSCSEKTSLRSDLETGLTTSAEALDQSFQNALKSPAKVINISLGFADNPDHYDSFQALIDSGKLIIVAAGNVSGVLGTDKFSKFMTHFGKHPNILFVTNIDPKTENLDDDSTYPGEEWQDSTISAPGTDVPTLTPQGVIELHSGTSYAAPIISAAAAYLLDQFSNRTPSDIAMFMKFSARKTKRDGSLLDPTKYGVGILDVTAALNLGNALKAEEKINAEIAAKAFQKLQDVKVETPAPIESKPVLKQGTVVRKHLPARKRSFRKFTNPLLIYALRRRAATLLLAAPKR